MKHVMWVLLMLLLAASASAQEPTLNELERLKIENLNLKTQLLKVQVKLEQTEGESAACQLRLAAPEIDKASAELVKAIEAGHPGFTFDPKTGMFTPKPPQD